MALKPEISLGVGLSTAAIVWAVYTHSMPGVADVRGAPANTSAIDSQRRVTTATAIGVVAGISLLAHDPTVFILGGGMVIVLDFMHRHASAIDNKTNKLHVPSKGDSTASYSGPASVS